MDTAARLQEPQPITAKPCCRPTSGHFKNCQSVISEVREHRPPVQGGAVAREVWKEEGEGWHITLQLFS